MALPGADNAQIESVEAERIHQGQSNGPQIHAGLTDFERQQKVGKLDILIDYNEHSYDEMPLTILEAMRYGVACVVPAESGWADDLPDQTVMKVAGSKARLEAAGRLIQDDAHRNRLANAARSHTRATNSHEQYARALVGLVLEPSPSARLATAEDIKKRSRG
jgi:hypothetical protein